MGEHDFGGQVVEVSALDQGDVIVSETGEPVTVVAVAGRRIKLVNELDIEVPEGVRVRRLERG